MYLCYAADAQLYFHLKIQKNAVAKGMAITDFVKDVLHWLPVAQFAV